MIGYKGFDKDFKCRDYQYEVGKIYEHDGEIGLCRSGFHFCKTMANVFNYYSASDCRYAEVEAIGDIEEGEDKCVTSKIRIVREIPMDEAVAMSNAGNWNTGNRNAGNCNTGNCNTGDWNAGNWNKSNYNSGCFMTIEPKIPMFNKPSDWTLRDWRESDAYTILRQMPKDIDVIDWIPESDMTDAEKNDHPTYKTTGSYIKVSKSNADGQAWWDGLDDLDKKTVKALPNFDTKIFEECTGIKV